MVRVRGVTGNLPFSYTIRRKRFSRVLRLAVHADGRLVVTAPVLMGVRAIERMIAAKAAWIAEQLRAVRASPPRVSAEEGKMLYVQHKADALRLVTERLAYFNGVYGLTWHRVSIKNARTRWGSCSGKGNLNFHYAIVFLPPALADYLVVHELCHLAHMNHSAAFWRLVARTIPDYATKRRELRRTSPGEKG